MKMPIDLIGRAQALDGESPSFFYANNKIVTDYEESVEIANILARGIFDGREEVINKAGHEIYSHNGRLVIKLLTDQRDEAGRVDEITLSIKQDHIQNEEYYNILTSSIDEFLKFSGRKPLSKSSKESLINSLTFIKKKHNLSSLVKKLISYLLKRMIRIFRPQTTKI